MRANDAAQTVFHLAVELVDMGATPEVWWPYLVESLDGRDRQSLVILVGTAVAMAAQYLAKEYGAELGRKTPNPELAERIRQDLNDAVDRL